MTAILERRVSQNLWGRFCNWITSTENRLYIGRNTYSDNLILRRRSK